MNKNYELIKSEGFDKLGITAFYYKHIETGARIVFAKSADANKTFGIGFKTPPTNSKGMAHIMEHSVLNGSKKYRTKDPFMDMASSSLQTFLNAMTYPDKTVFPVSSENDKDFRNLVDVYTDAVFAPLVLEKKEILDQEGWHFDLDDNDKVVGVSGVVYNEMKGALSDPESLISNEINSYLYKDSPYEYESGGNPADIKDLTFDDFVDFYKTHYHPSNAYIYYYGNIDDIDAYLTRLDEEYLSHYDYKDIDLAIEVVENHYEAPIEGTYPSARENENEDYLSYAMLTHSSLDIKETLTAAVLVNALFNMDSSKIRIEVQEKLSPEYFYARNTYGNRAGLIIQAQKADGDKLDDFVDIIEDGLKEASQGLNKEALKSAFSLFEFGQLENLNSVNAGLTYYLSMSFDADPFEVFKIVDYLKELRELIDTDYYENFIKDFYIDNPTRLIHLSKPSMDYNKKKDAEFKDFLNRVNKEMYDEKLEEIKASLKNLETYQNRENTEEEKATIPVLDLRDVPTATVKVKRLVEEEKFQYVFNDLNTAGLIYTELYFDINHLSLEDLKFAQIFAELAASIDTKNISYTEIDDIIWQKLGSINFSITNFRQGPEKIDRNFKVGFKTLRAYAKDAMNLVNDFAFNSIFDNKARILELLRIRKSIFESRMYDSGHMIAINRNNSHLDKASFIQENITGLAYYDFIKDVIKLCENDFESLREKLEKISKEIFTKSLSINIAATKEDYLIMKNAINDNLVNLKDKPEDVEIDFSPKPVKEAIASDANVNYVSKSAKLDAKSFKGSYMLASSIISNPYLYSLIRAKGGAYGAGMTITRALNLATYSYRDPNIEKTLEAYDQIPEIAASLEMSQRDFDNQKISSMGSILRPRSPKQMADSDYSYFRIKNAKKEDDILAEIKATKIEDIKAMADDFKKAMNLNNITVFGSREDIFAIEDKFDKVIDLKD